MARKPIPSILVPTEEFDHELVSRDDLYNAVDQMTVPETNPSTVAYSDIANSRDAPIEGLSVEDLIGDLTDSDGLVPVTVLVSHDNLYAGSRVRLPPSERLVSLIIAGWFEA